MTWYVAVLLDHDYNVVEIDLESLGGPEYARSFARRWTSLHVWLSGYRAAVVECPVLVGNRAILV